MGSCCWKQWPCWPPPPQRRWTESEELFPELLQDNKHQCRSQGRRQDLCWEGRVSCSAAACCWRADHLRLCSVHTWVPSVVVLRLIPQESLPAESCVYWCTSGWACKTILLFWKPHCSIEVKCLQAPSRKWGQVSSLKSPTASEYVTEHLRCRCIWVWLV